jgi:peptidoglycan/xylan/chitin deacetylase (PgdA/CDA1 family)
VRAILTYHSIDESGSPISLHPETFGRHVRWLSSGRVRVLPLSELVSLPDNDPVDAVALTFDDGFANFTTAAWPHLREHGLPATLFVVTGHVGGVNNWGGRPAPRIPTLPLATWDSLALCLREGVDIAAHTRTHPHLPSLESAQVADEIEASCRDIQSRLGCRPRSFAYPYGAVSRAAAVVAGGAVAWACTTAYRPLGADVDPHRLPRLDAYYFQRPDCFDGWGTSWFRCQIGFRHGLRTARAVAGALRP